MVPALMHCAVQSKCFAKLFWPSVPREMRELMSATRYRTDNIPLRTYWWSDATSAARKFPRTVLQSASAKHHLIRCSFSRFPTPGSPSLLWRLFARVSVRTLKKAVASGTTLPWTSSLPYS